MAISNYLANVYTRIIVCAHVHVISLTSYQSSCFFISSASQEKEQQGATTLYVITLVNSYFLPICLSLIIFKKKKALMDQETKNTERRC